jgi:hypothetical protein
MSEPKNKGNIVKYLWRMVGSLLQILVWNEMKYEENLHQAKEHTNQ